MLTGCAWGHLKFDHTPGEQQQEPTGHSVFVAVDDKRPYVINGDKEDYYIGHYRGGFGNVLDVTTFEETPLKEQIRTDLVEELESMGFASSDSGKKLSISIMEWNFDAYSNGRFWYEFKIDVLDINGDVIASDILEEEIVVDGSILIGPVPAFKKAMPEHYNNIIDKMVRSNGDILEALRM